MNGVWLGNRTAVLEKIIWNVLSDEVTFGQRYVGDEGRSYADMLEENCNR